MREDLVPVITAIGQLETPMLANELGLHGSPCLA